MRLRFDPSLDPYGNLERKLSDSAGEETAHCVRRLLLHGGSHVGVGVQREPGAVMSQHGGEDFHVYAVMQGQNRERVPLWHNKDKSENPCVATGWLVCPYSFSTKKGP